ncbi:unnamed protein product, partial [Meganyctiphanes norvegica]
MRSRPAPVFMVLVSGQLITCNFFWLYTANVRQPRGLCNHEGDSWASPGNLSLHPHKFDYQRVVGNGHQDVPYPIPVPNDTLLLGQEDMDDSPRRFLTIGISSVWRKDDYLTRTVDSILRESTVQERSEDVYLFLMLADADPNVRAQRASELGQRYQHAIQSGFLRVLQPPQVLYPSLDFSSIRRTYNDPISRVQWRTKQVLDFAFLFWYTWTRQPSQYYLILEDDVLSARHFVTAIKDFVSMHNGHHWVSLQLAGFLGIGQLVRCYDLDRLVSFLLLFYREHPVDMLVNHWVSLMAPEKPPKNMPTRRVPGLFQHIGVHSTLANKTQALKDNTFSLVKRRYSHVNPTADVVTTIRQYKGYLPEHAYSSAPGMFWGIPRPGDTFDILFPEAFKVKRVVIITGAAVSKKKKMRDKLLSGILEVSSSFSKMETPRKATCRNFVNVKEFQ